MTLIDILYIALGAFLFILGLLCGRLIRKRGEEAAILSISEDGIPQEILSEAKLKAENRTILTNAILDTLLTMFGLSPNAEYPPLDTMVYPKEKMLIHTCFGSFLIDILFDWKRNKYSISLQGNAGYKVIQTKKTFKIKNYQMYDVKKIVYFTAKSLAALMKANNKIRQKALKAAGCTQQDVEEGEEDLKKIYKEYLGIDKDAETE